MRSIFRRRSERVPSRKSSPDLEPNVSQGNTAIAKRSSKRSSSSSSTVRAFLRAIGLDILYLLIFELKRREEPKVLLNPQKRGFIRLSVHFLPICVTIVMAYFNLSTWYLGNELPGQLGRDDQKLACLQVVAKLYELLVVASLASIIFHHVRREVVFGDGVPIGVLSSGLTFSQLSYLWSKELWGGVTLKMGWRLLLLLIFVIASTLLATFVGPMSTVLILPRMDWHDAGGSSFWVVGGDDTLFPMRLVEQPKCVDKEFGLLCPAGGYYSILAFAGSIGTFPDSSWGFTVTDARAQRRFTTATKLSTYHGKLTTVYGPHHSLADRVSKVVIDYRSAMYHLPQKMMRRYPYKYSRTHKWTYTSKAPVVQVQCHGQIIANSTDPLIFETVEFSAEKQSVEFPEHNFGIPQSVVFDEASKRGVNLNNTFVKWIEFTDKLPEPAKSVSMGLFVSQRLVEPIINNGTNGTASNSMQSPKLAGAACTIDARWAPATYELTWLQSNGVSIHGEPCNDYTMGACLNHEWPRIEITEGWANHLSAPVMLNTGDFTANMTAIETLVEVADQDWDIYRELTEDCDSCTDGIKSIELAIASFVADGISRSGATHHNPNKLLPSEERSRQFIASGQAYTKKNQDQPTTELKAKVQIQGYGYGYTGGLMMRSSLAVLFLYVLVALSHIGYQLFRCKWSSDAWDSVPELVALAMNSRPSAVLSDASAGIGAFSTFRKKVFVGKPEEGHIELFFKDDSRVEMAEPVIGERYG